MYFLEHNVSTAVTPVYLSLLHAHSTGQKGSPRLRHFGFILHWETSFALLGRKTSTVVVRIMTTTKSRLRIPAHSQHCVMVKANSLQ